MQLYYNPVSAPCRAVLLFFQTINVQPEMKLINMEAGDHMTPEYLMMNPQHTIPLLVDDGFVLSESRAILGYLAEKYAMSMAYYPNDPMARGVVNHRLFFDQGTLYQRLSDTYLGPMFRGEGKMNSMAYEKIKEALGWLDIFIGDAPYMAGDKITIADYAMMATISTIDAVDIDLSMYTKVKAWFDKCKMEMKGYTEANGEGAKMWADMINNAFAMENS